jgi:Mn2+/Fe2+ NRAMP family transporter
MGTLVNKRSTTAIATLVVGVILSLNMFLMYLLVTGR